MSYKKDYVVKTIKAAALEAMNCEGKMDWNKYADKIEESYYGGIFGRIRKSLITLLGGKI